jgi:predicted ATPase
MNTQHSHITNIEIKGFKSIDSEGQNIPLEKINVLIGANGVGKSNLISFFEMLNAISQNKFQNYIRKIGGANSLLHYGAKFTSEITVNIDFIENDRQRNYRVNFAKDIEDSLFFEEEGYIRIDENDRFSGSNIKEATVNEMYKAQRNTDVNILPDFNIFQFNDTSPESKIRGFVYINDGRKLHSDGGNLAAFLYTLKNQKDNVKYYQRIVGYIKMVMPQFNDFELLPDAINPKNIMLNWHDNESEYLFGPHQISDGSLRFMALATLLLQPPSTLPALIVIDEPELGLHPAAISLLAAMVKIASQHSQIIIATQSTTLIDEFEAKDIIVVERENKKSIFKRLNIAEMDEWLKRYSLSEIWEKNIIGGR